MSIKMSTLKFSDVFSMDIDDIGNRFLLALENATENDIKNFWNDMGQIHERSINAVIVHYITKKEDEKLEKLMPLITRENEIKKIASYYITNMKEEKLEKIMPIITDSIAAELCDRILNSKQVNIIKMFIKYGKLSSSAMNSWAGCNNKNSITVEMFELCMELKVERYENIFFSFELLVKYKKNDMIKSLKKKILGDSYTNYYYYMCVKYGNIEVIKLLKEWGLICENNKVIERSLNDDEITEISPEILDLFKEGVSINFAEIFAKATRYLNINVMKKLLIMGVIDKFMANYALNELFLLNDVYDAYLELIELLRKHGASEISNIHIELKESKENEKVYNYMTEWSKEPRLTSNITTANEFKANIKDYAKQLMTTYLKEEMSKPNPNLEEVYAIIKTNENYN
jgi:hypothetical protein